MAVLSRFVSSLSGSGELRWILLPRRRSLSPCTQAGDGTGLFWSVFVQLGFSKGVVYDSWMVSLRASSPQSSSARPFSVLLRLKAMFLADRCLCSVKMFFSSLVVPEAHLDLLTSQHCIRSLELVWWCSVSTLCRSGGIRLVLGGDSKPALLDGFSPLWLVDALEVFRKLF
ncbi:hypothetical protein F2Q69_00017095 [Brassica cretica]|uniref:Uncharacterized protein n=1 Tax=Brassica cretica TaxID=69181 RepID=A0A8S9QM08_BRACR|nr:hypothetical protein F2Q69_00017095 [Brassica cretica]